MSREHTLRHALHLMNAITLEQLSATMGQELVFPDGSSFREFTHGLTCGNDSTHPLLFPWWDEETQTVGMRCIACKYVQNNAAHLGASTVNDDASSR